MRPGSDSPSRAAAVSDGIEKNQKPGALQIRVIFMWKWKMEKSGEWRAKGRASQFKVVGDDVIDILFNIHTPGQADRQAAGTDDGKSLSRYSRIPLQLLSSLTLYSSLRSFVKGEKKKKVVQIQ